MNLKEIKKEAPETSSEEVSSRAKSILIIELEKILGFSLKELEESSFFGNPEGAEANTYALDTNGDVTCICIIEAPLRAPKIINGFKKLKYLTLMRTEIEDISGIFPLPDLEFLYLGGNNIKDITSISQCTKLVELAIWGNPIQDIMPVAKLTTLKGLFCQRIELKDLSFVSDLVSLESFYGQDNYISDITILAELPHLIQVNLVNNLITHVPENIARNFSWLQSDFEAFEYGFESDGMYLDGNSLQIPPFSVINLGAKSTENYYELIDKFGHAPLSEGRIIFIGDGSSGKSSIIEKVLYNTFEKGRPQTNGIRIEHFSLEHPSGQRKLGFHIWDFGGQEIQHAVHRFFFTEGCLYVLVLDNRKEEDPDYWLQQVQSLGGDSPVMVVFNKQDENTAETSDRKYLKEKYPNIIGFYNTSCLSGKGIDDFKTDLHSQVVNLPTVDEQFPNNWLAIKKAIEEKTSGDQHYLTYESYSDICKSNDAQDEETQKLLLKYFNTIGVVTWFGDTYLNFLHVLKPAWITQGVYKILTSKRTAELFGQINVSDFKELLKPIDSKVDYTYDEKHYGYILSMMKKFDLCYSPDDSNLLIPSAFGKVPKVEYSDFRGPDVRTYILQFRDYMPLALIHRYTAKKLAQAKDNNYWYTGIVIEDKKSNLTAMIHADKSAKRIYVRIKGEGPLGLWEHVRREFSEIASSYSTLKYNELVAVDQNDDHHVNYDDLVSHLQAKKELFFHTKLGRDYNVGYLMGYFETKENTFDKVLNGAIALRETLAEKPQTVPAFVVNILNNNSPTVNAQANNNIQIDIDIQLVNNYSSEVKGDANYLIDALGESDTDLKDALKKIIEFADDAKSARNKGGVKEKGWGRKLKGVIQTLGKAGEQFKNIQDGEEAIHNMFKHLNDLAHQFNLLDVVTVLRHYI